MLRYLRPPVLQPLMRCHPGRLTKRSGEVPIRKFTGASEDVECDAPANVGIEKLFSSPLLPWCETASPLLWQCRDFRAHRQPQIAGDWIPNCGTRCMTQFLDVPRYVPVITHGHKRFVWQV